MLDVNRSLWWLTVVAANSMQMQTAELSMGYNGHQSDVEGEKLSALCKLAFLSIFTSDEGPRPPKRQPSIYQTPLPVRDDLHYYKVVKQAFQVEVIAPLRKNLCPNSASAYLSVGHATASSRHRIDEHTLQQPTIVPEPDVTPTNNAPCRHASRSGSEPHACDPILPLDRPPTSSLKPTVVTYHGPVSRIKHILIWSSGPQVAAVSNVSIHGGARRGAHPPARAAGGVQPGARGLARPLARGLAALDRAGQEERAAARAEPQRLGCVLLLMFLTS
ncbi:hypothetical protein ON010_g2149 [Phytophthora cinnamomi]|nr:hypothetical protein ON010_g2149 [Phytophthora cinnamomi]